MANDIYHTRLLKSECEDANERPNEENTKVIYPINSAEDVLLPSLKNIPENVKTLKDLIELINPNLLGDNFGKESLDLNNVTNDRQIKGLVSGTTEDHVLVFGKDGYTVKDSGHTIQSDVPKNAKFTDTTYDHASTTEYGVTILNDKVDSTSKTEAATANSVRKTYELADSKVGTVETGDKNGAIKVDGEDVFVHGLGSAAYKDSNDFATAEQGKKAESSLQAIRVGLVEECEPNEHADVVATTLKSITTLNFKLPKGVPGTKWYFGTAIFGNKKEPTVYIETKIVRARVDDVYLNTYNGNYFTCVKEGNNEIAEWVYKGTIGGNFEGGSGENGKSAYEIWLDEGNVGTETDFLKSLKGNDGSPGETPYIDKISGNWFIGSIDTGVRAMGFDGSDGDTPYIGTNNHWYIGDMDTGVVAIGKNGITPHIDEETGNWFIGKTDTGIKAGFIDDYGIDELVKKVESQQETINDLNRTIDDMNEEIENLKKTSLTTETFVEATEDQILEVLDPSNNTIKN